MKTTSVFLFLLLLSGCTTTDYSKLELSSASITNIEFSESENLKKRKHIIEVSFDYDISNYNDDNGLYFCSVHFTLSNDMTMYSQKGNQRLCQINQSTGNLSIKWPSPIDKSFNTPKETLVLLNYPLEFFVAIHQETNKNNNQIIGQSELQNSKI